MLSWLKDQVVGIKPGVENPPLMPLVAVHTAHRWRESSLSTPQSLHLSPPPIQQVPVSEEVVVPRYEVYKTT